MSDIPFDYADRLAIFDDPDIVFDGIGVVRSRHKHTGNEDVRLGRVMRVPDAPTESR